VPIDFAGDLEDVLDLDDLVAVGGTLTLPSGGDYAFTGARIVREERPPRGGRSGKTDLRRRSVLMPASGIPATPVANARVEFTGDTATWAVQEAEPIAPGGTTVAWRLTLVDVVDR
jgi:hypothetical protein